MILRYACIILIITLMAVTAFAGEYHNSNQLVCSDCHIMHAIKDNTQFVVTGSLLKHPGGEVGLCLSCHDGTDPNSPDIVSSGTSVMANSTVTTSYISKYGSSAGCFQSDYSTSANPYGHDLFTSGSTTTPLSSTYTKSGGLVCSDCHNPHGTGNYRNLLADPNPNHGGSVQMILGTQVKETVAVNATIPNPAQAYDTGNIGFYTAANIKEWCTDCHDQLATNTSGSSPAHFMGHPVDVALNAYSHTNPSNWTSGLTGTGTGFGTDIGDGSAGIPRLRFGSSTGSPNTASSGDTVNCLTCHKAHGSRYQSGLNWPFMSNTTDQYSGCQQCHYK